VGVVRQLGTVGLISLVQSVLLLYIKKRCSHRSPLTAWVQVRDIGEHSRTSEKSVDSVGSSP
jgi:hypothetical protein